MFSPTTLCYTFMFSGALLLGPDMATAVSDVPSMPPALERVSEPTAQLHKPAKPDDATVKPGPSGTGDFSTLATRNKKYWRLMELEGRPAEHYEHQPEPQILFMPESATQGRIGGADGCNRLVGGYTLGEGNTIAFTHLGSTRMLCPQGDAQGRLMQEMLGKVNLWRIVGDSLELWDTHRRLALFTAMPPDDGNTSLAPHSR